MRLTRMIVRIAAVTLVAATLACSAGRPDTPPPASPSVAVVDDGREGATLEVDNSSIFDVRMFVLRGSHQLRLGLVISGTRQEFAIPGSMLGRELVFYAEPVGSPARQRTDAVYVRPGQYVKLGLEKRLRSYTIAVH